MKSIIVADSGPLIALAKLQKLKWLLAIFSDIHIPETVLNETVDHQDYADSHLIRLFVQKYATIHTDKRHSLCTELREFLDEGEIQALCLADELKCMILLDEQQGRQIATQYNIPIIGIMGILLEVKKSGLVDAIHPFIEQLQQHDYYLSKNLIKLVLRRANEL